MKMSSWIARLLDFGTSSAFFLFHNKLLTPVVGIMEFRGIMTDCPDRLSAGASLMVTLRAYMLPNAFDPFKAVHSDDIVFLREDLETPDERLVFIGQHVI